MATMGNYRAETFTSGEAITQFHFVTLESDGQIDMADADAENCIGVAITDATAADRAVTVATEGRVKVQCGDTIAAGGAVVTNTSGEAVALATSASATAVTMGYAVDGGADGDVITIELIQGGNVSNES